MRKTFAFKLYNSKKNKWLHKQIDAAASIYNYCIAMHKCYFKLWGKHLNKFQLQKHITKLKKRSRYTHWNLVPSQAIQDITDRIARSYQLFFKYSRKGTRPPTFKKYKKYKSITLKQAGYKLLDDNKIMIGKKTYSLFKSRDIEGAIKTLTIKRDALGDVYLFFSCDVKDSEPNRIMTGKSAGFDFGLKIFLTSSDGTKIDAPLFFKKGSGAIKKASRLVSSKKKGSNNRSKARVHLARCHKKIANQRKDYHVKLAQKITQEHDYLFFEDLTIKGMQRIWGRKISDLGFSAFMEMVGYYCQLTGAQMQVIDKFFPSSKMCHVCKKIYEALSLNERSWQCQGCNSLHDRDINAAMNIAIVGASTIGLGNVRPPSVAISA